VERILGILIGQVNGVAAIVMTKRLFKTK
jgi:hypothetical protein